MPYNSKRRFVQVALASIEHTATARGFLERSDRYLTRAPIQIEIDELDHVIDHQFFISDRTFYMRLADLGGETDAADHGQREASHLGRFIDFYGQRVEVTGIRIDRHPTAKIDRHVATAVKS